MNEGRIQKVKWDNYESPMLNLLDNAREVEPKIKWPCSCATAALTLLTRQSQRKVENRCVDVHSISSTRMKAILTEFGYGVKEVTKMALTNVQWSDQPLTENHVLLLNIRLDVKENSAFVLHQSVLWHNFDREIVSPMFFINKPIQDCYIVTHPTWRKNASHSVRRNRTR